ncbi:hypothetical protein Ato02nite_030130 [Paractinoplanes toevensis]|uniref:Uncharacterized protein n=1 Tax=Paractinoplanes toevensis TaxID=571911 RepID=A0A919W457_9ACTN|nr:hypothetical protein Ato02nite_030130 [Actinoplanes toevensis]
MRPSSLFARLKQRTVAPQRLYSYQIDGATGATVTNRYEQLKAQRRMQRRIQLVVEERRMARAAQISDPERTIEIPPQALRAIGRVPVTAI